MKIDDINEINEEKKNENNIGIDIHIKQSKKYLFHIKNNIKNTLSFGFFSSSSSSPTMNDNWDVYNCGICFVGEISFHKWF